MRRRGSGSACARGGGHGRGRGRRGERGGARGEAAGTILAAGVVRLRLPEFRKILTLLPSRVGMVKTKRLHHKGKIGTPGNGRPF